MPLIAAPTPIPAPNRILDVPRSSRCHSESSLAPTQEKDSSVGIRPCFLDSRSRPECSQCQFAAATLPVLSPLTSLQADPFSCLLSGRQ